MLCRAYDRDYFADLGTIGLSRNRKKWRKSAIVSGLWFLVPRFLDKLVRLLFSAVISIII